MIDITQDIETRAPNAFTKARECFVRRLAVDKYLVTPKRYSKSRRLVTFILTGESLKALCQDYRTLESCPANAFKTPCYHIARALLHAQRLANRKEAA